VIGVLADQSEELVVREFFQLFKTPWEFYDNSREYDVVLCAGDHPFNAARLVLVYAGRKTSFDIEHDFKIASQRSNCILSYKGDRIPTYGTTVTFSDANGDFLKDEVSGACSAHISRHGESIIARIGYDLFSEIRTLLTSGQSPANANIPTLELHVALLRDLIIDRGLSLFEIPPIPEGYGFIVCLTHDIDNPSIRRHRWDYTMCGFLHRAVFGSIGNFLGGRLRFQDLIRNLAAASTLPFVYLGIARDFWREFDDGYLDLEAGLASTFFVIVSKNNCGQRVDGRAQKHRASKYEARDIADAIQKLMAAGCEIGLHGIDAWLDCVNGREEFERIRRLTGVSEVGVRMHWLYYDAESPAALERAGVDYDSTIGFNETVGYRAGTTQAYKPLQATRLLELPLHVMDTALFYPDYLGLTPNEARVVINRMVDNAIQFGGCLTINWHDRSLFPERLWGSFYRELLESLKSRRAWFATAGQAVAWFRKRRATVFERDTAEPEAVCARVTSDSAIDLPRLLLRFHGARSHHPTRERGTESYVDLPFEEQVSTNSVSSLAFE
jgi:hypothetical protein